MGGPSTKPSVRGRRAGSPQTKEEILAEARSQFAAAGFADTSIRSVAAAAGVDPSLVTHYYGTKEGLFVAALGALDELPAQMIAAMTGGLDGLGRRLTTTYLSLWDEPVTGIQLRAIYRSTASSATAATLVHRGLAARVLPEAVQALPADVITRLPVAIGQLLGTAICRYVFEIPEITALTTAELIDILTPGIDATLSKP